VELSLIRAATGETLETSDHTSVQRRIETLIQDSVEVAAGEASGTEDADEMVSPSALISPSALMKPDRFLSAVSIDARSGRGLPNAAPRRLDPAYVARGSGESRVDLIEYDVVQFNSSFEDDSYMVRTASTMMPLGTAAPDFSLPETDGGTVSLADFTGHKALLVMFVCNHCPFVKHVAEQLKLLSDEYMQHGVGVVGINSNDIEAYPDDDFDAMKAEKADRGYAFPYALDADQAVAIAYGAACTPDFFLFDADHKLNYRGQLDSSRPKSGVAVTGVDLRAAIDETIACRSAMEDQKPSIGCNIKWKPGNEPGYFDPSGVS